MSTEGGIFKTSYPWSDLSQPIPSGDFQFQPYASESKHRQATLDKAFTREQQQALGLILETWWSMKMAGIETQRIDQTLVSHANQLASLNNSMSALVAATGRATFP